MDNLTLDAIILLVECAHDQSELTRDIFERVQETHKLLQTIAGGMSK